MKMDRHRKIGHTARVMGLDIQNAAPNSPFEKCTKTLQHHRSVFPAPESADITLGKIIAANNGETISAPSYRTGSALCLCQNQPRRGKMTHPDQPAMP